MAVSYIRLRTRVGCASLTICSLFLARRVTERQPCLRQNTQGNPKLGKIQIYLKRFTFRYKLMKINFFLDENALLLYILQESISMVQKTAGTDVVEECAPLPPEMKKKA